MGGATLPLLYLPPISLRIFLKKTYVLSKRNACFWNPPTLAVSRVTFGASLGPSWAILKPPWSHLGPYWAHLGPILGLPGATPAEFTQNLPGQSLRNAKFALANFALRNICPGKF